MKIVVLPCSFDNYGYLIICEETGETAIVDPGEYYPISSEIERTGATLKSIFCTHHHADHIGGLEDLLGEFPGLSVYGYESDRRRIPGMNYCKMGMIRIFPARCRYKEYFRHLINDDLTSKRAATPEIS